MKKRRKLLSLFLCVIMAVSLCPQIAFAEVQVLEDNGLCEHHPQHTGECGYIAAQAEIPCDMGCKDTDGDEVVDHVEGCAYQPAVEGEACGYICEICGAKDSGEPAASSNVIDSVVLDVQALIDALPMVEELEEMSAEGKNSAYMQAQDASDAYDTLAVEQQEQVDDTKLIEVLGYFSNQATEQSSDAVTVTIDGKSQGYADINSACNAARGHTAIIELEMDVSSSSAIEINDVDTNITFKGGDYTFSGRIIVSNGSFTLESGKIDYWSRVDEAVTVDGGTVIVNGGTIEGDPEAIQVNSGSLTINGGTFTGSRVLQLQGGETLIKDGTFTASSYDTVACVNDGTKNVTVTIEGGGFFHK